MTNSTPKNSKIERQGSPNSNGKQRSGARSSNYVKTVTYFAGATSTPIHNNNGGRNSRTSNGRQSSSPPCSTVKNNSRNSPIRHDSPRSSPTNSFYAGAKFSEPPSPASLPKPPKHWTQLMMDCRSEAAKTCQLSENLKAILNIQA